MPGKATTARHARAQTRRREHRKATYRTLVIDACCAAGLLLTLPWALAAPTPALDCGMRQLGACIGEGFTATAMPILLRAALGVLLGASVGVLLCRTIPALKRRSLA